MESLSVAQVQALIEELYSSTDPSRAKLAQEQLLSIQRLPQAWSIASELLSLQSDQCRFFGAHTFQVKISRDWDSLTEDQVELLREKILEWIVHMSPGSMLVTTKLCLALIAFAVHTVPHQWQHFVSATVEALRRGGIAYGVAPYAIEVTILEFLTLVPEEISSTELSGDRKSKLVQEMKESVPLVLSIMSSMLFSTTPTETNLQQKTLRCFQSWVQYGIEFEAAYPLLQQTMVLVTKEDTFEIATEVLLEAMQQHTWLRYNTLRDDMLQCITSEEMKTQFTGSISEQDEDTSKSLAKLFTAYGEAYADFIAEQLCRQDILVLMDMLMQLTAFSGYFPVDQELSDIPLNFWYVLQETLIDDGILPVQDSTQVVSLDGEDDLSLDKSTVTKEKRQWRRQCGEAALMIYRQLVITIQQKAMFPPDNVWNSWTQDIRDKFKIYRRDIGDTMINPYYVLRGELLSILLEHAVAVMDHWDSIPFSSQDLEATLFCLKSVSEEVSPEENEHIHKFFGAKIFGRLPREGHTRLQNTAILLMGSLSEWLNQHPQLLAQIMNYLVPCLSVPKLALSAASTFSDICDACREPLTDELDNLINTYNVIIHTDVEFNVKQKVVVSIANVIQVLPPDIAISPIMTIITSILQYSSEALEMVKSDPELAQSMILIQLKYLSAFSKGIQSPSDDYQSVSTRHKFYDSFVRGELTTIYTTIEGVAQISDAMRDLTRDIARVWSTDEQVMKILSSFLELGTRSANPIFALPFPDLILLVQISYQHSLFSCWLNTAKFIVTVYGGQESCYPTFLEVIASITDSTLKLITNTQDMETHPEVVGGLFDIFSTVVVRCPVVFYQFPREQINTIFMFCIAGMGLQEKLALKSAVHFMIEFVSQEYDEGTQMAAITSTLITSMGPQILEKILMGIGGHIPRSLSGPLLDVLFKLVARHTAMCREWLPVILFREGFPSNRITQEEKAAFIKGILGTRSWKKFKDVVGDFSVTCRGLRNASFGSVQ